MIFRFFVFSFCFLLENLALGKAPVSAAPLSQEIKKETKLKETPTAEKTEKSKEPAEKTEEKKKIAKKLSLKEVAAYQSSMLDAKAMSVDFHEELYRQARKITLYKEGHAYFIKPDKFRWEVVPKKKKKTTTSSKEIWIFDGEDLFQHSTKEKYATRYSSKLGKNKQLRELVDIITNFKALLATYTFEGATEEDALVKVKLSPKRKSEIATLDITLETVLEKKKKKTFMKELTLHFEDKNRTKFVFAPMKEEKIDKKQLTIPKGIKVTSALD